MAPLNWFCYYYCKRTKNMDAYEQFYKAQTGVAIYKAFRTCTNGIKNYKEKGGK